VLHAIGELDMRHLLLAPALLLLLPAGAALARVDAGKHTHA